MPEITNKHKDFARAVIVLAREHGANRVSMEFDFSSSKAFCEEWPECRFQKLSLSWKEGRHGARELIDMHASENVRVKEEIEAT